MSKQPEDILTDAGWVVGDESDFFTDDGVYCIGSAYFHPNIDPRTQIIAEYPIIDEESMEPGALMRFTVYREGGDDGTEFAPTTTDAGNALLFALADDTDD